MCGTHWNEVRQSLKNRMHLHGRKTEQGDAEAKATYGELYAQTVREVQEEAQRFAPMVWAQQTCYASATRSVAPGD